MKPPPFIYALCGAVLAGALAVSAQTITTSTNYSVSAAIPDGNTVGLASFKTVSTPIRSVTDLQVRLTIDGTFNGDLYCFLAHNSGFTVLLNRVGRRGASGLGCGDAGLDVTYDSAATNGNAHVYRLTLNGNHNMPITGALTNAWVPDGRTNSPLNVLDTDTPTALLSSFNGVDPNGAWTLFVADVEAGDLHTLVSWGLEITGYTGPQIAAQPAAQSAECSSGHATFSVSAGGSAPLAYQWRFAGSPIANATNYSLTISNATFVDQGNYDVVITNSFGSVTSSVATLTIVDTTAPVVTLIGGVTNTVECHGSYIDPGATAADSCAGPLTVSTNGQVDVNTPGAYTIQYVATDPGGNAATNTRAVIVSDTTPPAITCPTSLAVTTTNAVGAAASFVVTAQDVCAGDVVPVCTPPSGSVFAIGTTIVQCMATDGSSNASTCSFTATVVRNHAPIASTDQVGALGNQTRIVKAEKLLANDADEDGDVLTIVAVSGTSTNGGGVALSGTNVIYTPVTNFAGMDAFTYTLSDGRGATAMGLVIVQVTSPNDPSNNRIGDIIVTPAGVKVRFAGIPGFTYTVERSVDLLIWTGLGSFTVPDHGLAEFDDTSPPTGEAFYRTVTP